MNISQDVLKQLSNVDLKALSENNVSKISNAGLKFLSNDNSANSQNILPINKMPQQKQLPIKNFFNIQKREGLGMLQGVADFGSDIGDLYIRSMNGVNHLLHTGNPVDARTPRLHLQSPENANSRESKVGHFVGELAPSFLLPESKLIQGASKIATGGKAATTAIRNFFAKQLPRVLDSGITGGTQAAIYNSGDDKANLPKSFLQGAAVGSGLHAVIGAIPGAAENYLKFIRHKAEKSNSIYRSPQAVANIQKQLGETHAPFTTIARNHHAMRSRASLMRLLPFSRVQKYENQLVQSTQNHAKNIMSDLLGSSNPESIENDIIQHIRQTKNKNLTQSHQLFQTLMNDADKAKIQIKPIQLKAVSKSILKDSDNLWFPALPPAKRKMVQQIVDNPKFSFNLNFNKMHTNHSEMGKLIEQTENKGELREALRLSKIQNAIHQDIERSLKQSGQAPLLKQWQEARAFFKSNVVPYRQGYIQKLLNGTHNASTTANRLLSNEQSAVFNQMPQLIRSKVAHLLLSRQAKLTLQNGDKLDPIKLAKSYEQLSPSIKNRLFSNAQEQQFDQLLTFANLSQHAFKRLNQSNNVFSNMELLKLGGELGGLKYLLGSALSAAKTGGAGIVANRALAKYLYSPKIREHYIQQSVGNPQLHSQAAKYFSAPINLSTSRKQP